MRDRVAHLGCAAAAIALLGFGIYLAVAVPAARYGLLALLAVIPLSMGVTRWRLARAVRDFRAAYGSAGKDLLLVYTASPHWQPYIEQNWLSRWQARAVALNRSTPGWEAQPETGLWRRMAGLREHTPVAIVIPSVGRPRIFRFYKAFRDHKHGKPASLHALEGELTQALLTSAP